MSRGEGRTIEQTVEVNVGGVVWDFEALEAMVEGVLEERVGQAVFESVVDGGGLRGALGRDPTREEILAVASWLPGDCWIGRARGRLMMVRRGVARSSHAVGVPAEAVDLLTGERVQRPVDQPQGGPSEIADWAVGILDAGVASW